MKTCTRCGETKPLEAFGRWAYARDGRKPECKDCGNEARRRYCDANRERVLLIGRESARRARAANPEKFRDKNRRDIVELRDAVRDHYGWVCACCGSTERLQIDHIKGDGAEHRRELFGRARGNGSARFYRWLIRQGFPEGYQTLCLSCNSSKNDGDRCRLEHSGAVRS